MALWPVDYYRAESGRSPVHDFLRSLKAKEQAKCIDRIEWLESYDPAGPPPAGFIHYIGGDIYELRRPWNRLQYRFLFARTKLGGNRVILLHGFVKKTDAVDAGDRRLAEERLGDYRMRGLA